MHETPIFCRNRPLLYVMAIFVLANPDAGRIQLRSRFWKPHNASNGSLHIITIV